MYIQIRKFKTFIQLISTLIIVFVWVSVALSDIVLPKKNNAEELIELLKSNNYKFLKLNKDLICIQNKQLFN